MTSDLGVNRSSLQLGFDLRDDAVERLEGSRADWLASARDVARQVCREQGFVTADDVRARLPIPPQYDGRVMGAVFSKSMFRKIGYQATMIPTSHSRPIAVFKVRT